MTARGAAPVGIPIAAATSFIASVVGFFAKEFCSEFWMWYSLRLDWKKFTTITSVKTLKNPLTDKKVDEKEGEELKN